MLLTQRLDTYLRVSPPHKQVAVTTTQPWRALELQTLRHIDTLPPHTPPQYHEHDNPPHNLGGPLEGQPGLATAD
jgi:hypothetical protein